MADPDHEDEVDEARSLLESVALLEKVAANREAKAQSIMGSLAESGMSAGEIADELDISDQSARAMLGRTTPKPPHERAGVSEETIEKLDSVAPDTSEAV